METKNLSGIISSTNDQNLTLNRQITAQLSNGNVVLIAQCHATIKKETNINYFINILDKEIYKNNKELVQVEIDLFKKELTIIAQENGVPF